MPMPEGAPVTITRLPERSIPAATSAAVDRVPNGVVMRVIVGLYVGIAEMANPAPPRPGASGPIWNPQG
jgi:hypothetical protein